MLKNVLLIFMPKSPSLLLKLEHNFSHISPVTRMSVFPAKIHLGIKTSYPKSVLNKFSHELNFSSSCMSTDKVEKLSNIIISDIGEDFEVEQVEELNKVLTFLFSKGFTAEDVKGKCITYLNSGNCSYQKFNELECIGTDLSLLLPLLSLPLSILRLAAKQARHDRGVLDFPDRIAYLSHHLELKASDLIPLLVKHSALLTMKFTRLDYKMKTLKNANISPKYIVKDLWIFNYNENLLVNRIQAALQADVELKPWMLRCSKKFFESMLLRTSETQRILDGESVVNYLAKKLHCNTEYVEYMMERNKLLKAINIPKLDQIMYFLFEKGYTPQEVRLFPRVFCSSVQTLSERFEKYQRMKSTLPTISQLCISSKNFERKLKAKS